jgi:hypothetical protein
MSCQETNLTSFAKFPKVILGAAKELLQAFCSLIKLEA